MNRNDVLRTAARTLVSALALMTAAVSAQEPQPAEAVPLTLEDAVRRAVEHNPDLAIVRLATAVEAARVNEARSAFEPVFSSTIGRSGNASAPSNILTGASGIDTNEVFSSTGVRKRLRRGAGTWSVSWDASRTATNSPFTSFDPSLQSGLQVAFSQPLFKDRAMDAARHQEILAQRGQSSSELRLRESEVQTVASVKQAYWILKATIANVTVQQRSVELAQDLVRENRARVEVGQSPPLDLVQAEAEVAQRRENLIRAETLAKDAEDRLRHLIMDPADASFWQVHLNPVDTPVGATPPPDMNAAVTRALADRHDLARARQELDNANTKVQFLTNQKLPDVRLEASYRGGGTGGAQLLRTGPFPGVISGRLDSGFGDVLGQVFRNSYPIWSLGVTVSYPLGRSYEESSLVRAEVERRQAAQSIASLQLRIAETVRQAARQVQSTAERIDATRAGATLAEQRLEVEKRRFDAGLSTTFLVTQAQRDLLQAQVDLLQATLDHQSSIVNFEAVQLAPATENAGSDKGANVVSLPTPEPRGLFRLGGGT